MKFNDNMPLMVINKQIKYNVFIFSKKYNNYKKN